MFDGMLTLKLGGFMISKPNFTEYSRKNEIKILKNQPKFEIFWKNIENKADWKFQSGMPLKM